MKNRKNRSAIINISSVAAISCPGYAAIYSATKGYMTALSKALSAELNDKIDVLTVSPATVSTKMTQKPKA